MNGQTDTRRHWPEVILYHKYNEKVDVYSFGTVVWEMFSRDVPYSSLSAVQVALAAGSGSIHSRISFTHIN